MDKQFGRCLCGAVTFEAAGRPLWSAVCHCESCRRATAAPSVAYVGFPEEMVLVHGDALRTYASSPGVERTFCGICGTSISYRSTRWPGEVHLFTASFDDPEAFPPDRHVYEGERLEWHVIGDTLRRYRTVGGQPVGPDDRAG